MADPVPWTFAAGGEPTERLEWLTDVMSAPTGAEQRRGLRLSPRVSLGFSGLEVADDRRWLEQQLASNGAGRWLVPIIPEGSALDAIAVAGTNALSMDTRWRRFVAGGQALVLGDSARQLEVVSIDAVADDQLVLAAGTTLAWASGARVFPVLPGRLEQAPSLSRFTGDAVPYAPTFRLDPPIDWPADAGTASYRGCPVFEWGPDWSSDPQWTPERPLQAVDNGTAPPLMTDLVGRPLSAFSVSVSAVTLTQVAELRGLLYALAGRLNPIWMPSRAQDLRVVAPVASGATVIDVARCGYSDAVPAENRRDVRIELANGSVIYRRITASAVLGEDAERLVLDAPIVTGFAVPDVAAVSFLALCRQEADTALLRWWSAGVARCDLQFRAVLDGL